MNKKLLTILTTILVLIVGLITSSAADNEYLGDIDNNGTITAADARAILRFSAKLDEFSAEQEKSADVDGNGTVNAADARITLRISAKLEKIEDYIKDSETTTETPITEDTEEPTTEEPTTEEPTTEEPTTEEPTTEEPTTEEPTTEEPTTEKPTTEEPTTEEPATEEPTTEIPTTTVQPDISVDEYEYEVKPGETKIIVFPIHNIEDYYIYLYSPESESRDFIFDCKKYDDYAEVYVTAKDVLLCNIPIGSENSADFKLTVALLNKDKEIVDSEEIRIFSKYTDEEKVNGLSITEINHIYMEYDYVNEDCNFYLSFADANDNCISTYGRMTIAINDKEGDSVYNGEHDFVPDDFFVKSIKNEEELVCRISIPFSEFSGNIIYEGEIKISIITPWINWENPINPVQVSWNNISVPFPEFEENFEDNNTLTDPTACIDYGHLVSSGLCMRCSSYLLSDLSFYFGDENSNLLPAETTCNILGNKTSATINRITNVSAVKNYKGNYDVTVTAEVDVTTPVYSGDNGFFTVCLIDGNTNTTVMSEQISYNGYGKQQISFSMEDVEPGAYAITFMSIDISL